MAEAWKNASRAAQCGILPQCPTDKQLPPQAHHGCILPQVAARVTTATSLLLLTRGTPGNCVGLGISSDWPITG